MGKKRALQIEVPVQFIFLCGATPNDLGTNTVSSISEMSFIKKSMIEVAAYGWKNASGSPLLIQKGMCSGATVRLYITFPPTDYTDWLFAFPASQRRFQFFQTFLQGVQTSRTIDLDGLQQEPPTAHVHQPQPVLQTAAQPSTRPAARLAAKSGDPFADLAMGISAQKST